MTDSGSRPAAARCLVVWLAATAAVGGGGRLCARPLVDLPGRARELLAPGRFEDLVVVLGAAAGVVALAWLWLVATGTVLAALRGRLPTPDRVGTLRRAVLVLCGVALTTTLAGQAHATDGQDLSGLPYPDRPSVAATTGGAAHPGAPTTTDPGADADARPEATARPVAGATAKPVALAPPDRAGGRAGTHVVAPGETLWGIATATLAPGAPVDLVDVRWREIHRLNLAVVGDDPHLIRPGQRLVLPDAGPTPGQSRPSQSRLSQSSPHRSSQGDPS
ncbi:LysM peptidoglycan-binding domain-containing protein [Nocardioides solisilvae]|uniref:LysM peptidoglycan-binding domain-containing protein n=1 Tax=Nocardioides solisilvae TaxID=1542435 RepID=UPI000D744359|nr:LysM domain-containing protein [Nocardioides solisilvae]